MPQNIPKLMDNPLKESKVWSKEWDDYLYHEAREFYDCPVEIGQWCPYAPYVNEEQLELQRENLVEISDLHVAEGRLKLIYTKRMKTLCDYLKKAMEKVPLTAMEVSMETEIFFTSKIEGAKIARVRTTEIHNGAPIDENNKDSETMVRNGFRAAKILSQYGNKISKNILCEVWNILVEDCCQNEDIRGAEDEYRIGDLWVGNHEGVPHSHVEDAMKRWIAFYNSEELNEHLFLKAAVLHYAFENIHPFPDGNGRLGRLLMNNFLIKNGVESAKAVSFSMAIDANRGLYDGAFVSSENELADCTPFVEYMLEVMAKAYSTALVSNLQ